jgi:hypothetical protein
MNRHWTTSNRRAGRAGAWSWWIAVALLACPAARAGSLLDDYVRLQSGDFTSEAQARQDPGYQVALWHIVEIWRGADAGERWLYSEAWLEKAPAPYIQRITRLRIEGGGTIVASRQTIPEGARFVGAWSEPGRFAALKPSELTALPGCEVMITRAGAGRFEGSTVGDHCRNAYKGAAYAVSYLALTADGMTNWDRGFDADGNLKWGPAAGGYQLLRSPAPVVR